MQLELPTSKYPENQQVTVFCRQLLERVKAIPGMQGAAVGNQPLPSEEKVISLSKPRVGRWKVVAT
jgi:hypothetical protein